ncbi:MAG: hypothetical protein K2H61_08550, partial [Muribaculaceae bacterium]|nr:hypothetical protein [Muribaculaceae bacterium]
TRLICSFRLAEPHEDSGLTVLAYRGVFRVNVKKQLLKMKETGRYSLFAQHRPHFQRGLIGSFDFTTSDCVQGLA